MSNALNYFNFRGTIQELQLGEAFWQKYPLQEGIKSQNTKNYQSSTVPQGLSKSKMHCYRNVSVVTVPLFSAIAQTRAECYRKVCELILILIQ